MSDSAWGLLFLAVLAVAMPAGMIVVSWVAGRPRTGSLTDVTPYECGKKPFTSARRRYSVGFYLIAMLFIVFDIEAAFLYPWALQLGDAAAEVGRGFVLAEMLVFLTIVIAGFVYVWARGALDWES
ncbi:MAG: NADH-quinone oxidoreductase subunit A [Acidobacteria bacterium]|nr:MAG: NADH-quinone oxidoreductase subunit A [Acidobacteriota bacterium]